MLYEFELIHNAVKTAKNICCMKTEGAVNYNKVTRWFNNFCSSCKNLSDLAMLDRPQTMDSEAVLQVI